MNTSDTSPSSWHFKSLSDALVRFMHAHGRASLPSVPVRMTRRQELLAAQEQRRREQRAHVLELLREVKEKHQNVSHV